MSASKTDYSYYKFLLKLCQNNYNQVELNNFIERLFKIGESYIQYSLKRIKRFVDSNQDTLEEIAIEAIAPLFQNASYNNHFIIVDKVEDWDPPIKSEDESLFFLNKVISNRVEQQISLMLRESDPFFSRILDSVNYLIRKGNYKKLTYLGRVYIIEPASFTIDWIVISDDEFKKIPSYLFFERKTLLTSLFNFLSSETPYFPAIPLNELIYRLKHINLSNYLSANSIDDVSSRIEINEIVNSALSMVEEKIDRSYLEKGKLNNEECNRLKKALKLMADDLADGGVNQNLYKYFHDCYKGLTKDIYQQKYHNILEYLLKVLKNKIAEEFTVK